MAPLSPEDEVLLYSLAGTTLFAWVWRSLEDGDRIARIVPVCTYKGGAIHSECYLSAEVVEALYWEHALV
jgi:hypothetical protein